MELGPGEPAAGPWRVVAVEDFALELVGAAGTHSGRPRIVAVDGRGGGGKTALAERLVRVLAPAAVVHSDDVAWEHSRFGWDDLMAEHVLRPLRAGDSARFRPPGWVRAGREGGIAVDAGLSTVVVEGVGVGRRSLAPLVDVVVWVQSDYVEAKVRGTRRDIAEMGRTEEEASRIWDEWEIEEVPFLQEDRPWERARFIVGTASSLPHDPDREVMMAE